MLTIKYQEYIQNRQNYYLTLIILWKYDNIVNR